MKGILFNQEMVRAILDGRKSVTRRVVKPQPLDKICYTCMGYKHGTWTYPSDDVWRYWGEEWRREQPLPEAGKDRRWTPPCQTDDILYVRERFAHIFGRYFYRADYQEVTEESKAFWRPSIHMPKEAARLFLRVTNVRVERLREMEEKDAIAEGIRIGLGGSPYFSCLNAFKALWDSTIRKADLPAYGWDSNPWVWVIEFERISKEEAQKGGKRNG